MFSVSVFSKLITPVGFMCDSLLIRIDRQHSIVRYLDDVGARICPKHVSSDPVNRKALWSSNPGVNNVLF